MAPTVSVTMIASVDTEHVAGEKYDIPADLADSYIHKGYASGTPSREFSDDEITALTTNDQKVGN